MIVIISGVSGVGKTTVGKLLAANLNFEFFDADDFHSDENIGKMSRGIPLEDDDRREWLAKLVELIESLLNRDGSAVLACSALKRAYREKLSISKDVKLVLLNADFKTISERLLQRRDHFMDSRLLMSQFEILESVDEDVLVIDASLSPEAILDEIKVSIF